MGTVTDAHELKGLQVQLARAVAASRVAREEQNIAQRKHNQSTAICKSLTARIAELEAAASQKEPIVSEHALLRYLERIEGIDLAAIREKILGDGTAASISFARSGRIKKNGVTLIIQDGVVVTVE